MPHDGDAAIRQVGDLEERADGEVKVVHVAARHARVGDDDGNALRIIRVRERD